MSAGLAGVHCTAPLQPLSGRSVLHSGGCIVIIIIITGHSAATAPVRSECSTQRWLYRHHHHHHRSQRRYSPCQVGVFYTAVVVSSSSSSSPVTAPLQPLSGRSVLHSGGCIVIITGHSAATAPVRAECSTQRWLYRHHQRSQRQQHKCCRCSGCHEYYLPLLSSPA